MGNAADLVVRISRVFNHRLRIHSRRRHALRWSWEGGVSASPAILLTISDFIFTTTEATKDDFTVTFLYDVESAHSDFSYPLNFIDPTGVNKENFTK